MIWDPSTLAQLSAPGFNRNLGAGDVVPYWPRSSDPGMATDAMPATPGVSFDPVGGGTPAGSTSFLNNLSALTPLFDFLRNQQQGAAITSGQGNAQAQPPAAATPGVGSSNVAGGFGTLPIAGAPVPSSEPTTGIGTPGVSTSGMSTGDAGGGTGPGPDAGGPGPGVGDAGAGPGPDAGGPGDAGGPSGGPSSDSSGAGGGAGGGGGDGGSVLVSYTVRHMTGVPKRVLTYWERVRARLLMTPEGPETYRRYQATAKRLTARLDALSPAVRGVYVQAMAMTLFYPFEKRSWAEDDTHALRAVSDTVLGLARIFDEPVEV